jgi:circadian clock protein KaiB
MTLFVAGAESNSRIARNNIENLCEREIKGRFELEIIDVLEDFVAALEHGILVTPTLLITRPDPPVTILGNLTDLHKVRAALHIEGTRHNG